MNIRDKTTKSMLELWPEDGLESVTKCPVCGSGKREPIHEGLTDRVFFCAPGSWSMFRCADCRSGYLDPRPTEKTIGLAYYSYFTHQSNDTINPSLTIRKKIRRALANGYRNWRFGSNHRPATIFGILAVMLMPVYRRILDASMRHLPRPKSNQLLLDFGCGNGEFLMQAKAAGWKCVGIDLDPKAVETAREHGLDVSEGGIDALKAQQRQFDVITLSHVIEHVHDPKALLMTCHERLKPGGALWIETPNLNSQGHEIFGADWRDLDAPRHLVLFTPQSLSNLLLEVGFQRVEHQTEHPAIPMVFGASEAIRDGGDPWQDGPVIASKKNKQWRKYERRAKTNVDIREFITLTARKKA